MLLDLSAWSYDPLTSKRTVSSDWLPLMVVAAMVSLYLPGGATTLPRSENEHVERVMLSSCENVLERFTTEVASALATGRFQPAS